MKYFFNLNRMSIITLFLILILGGVFSNYAQQNSANAKNYKFTNGNWFDGKTFKKKDFYSVGGIFSDKKPKQIDETIDLKNGYIVPPFGDAHCHHFDVPSNVKKQVEMYLRDGVFYAKVQGNIRSGALKVADSVNKPTSVDVSYAHGALTRTFGHGLEIFETQALGLIPITSVIEANKTKIAASRRRENDAYYIIDTFADLENKWQKILEGKPDFLKIYLLNSENFEENRKNIPNIKLGHIGLAPQLVPTIVQKAHTAGLRVSAHVETAMDYRIALEAGVDEMAHLPGYYFGLDEKPEKYQLTEKDVKETFKHKIRVIPTPNLPQSFNDSTILERVGQVAKHNLKLLKRNRARLAFGADAYMSTPVEYVLYIAKLGVFTNLEMLKIWCEDTSQAIFPSRKIGHLKKGYEASFLALTENPLENLEAVKNISFRFKQGFVIDVPTQKQPDSKQNK